MRYQSQIFLRGRQYNRRILFRRYSLRGRQQHNRRTLFRCVKASVYFFPPFQQIGYALSALHYWILGIYRIYLAVKGYAEHNPSLLISQAEAPRPLLRSHRIVVTKNRTTTTTAPKTTINFKIKSK